MSKPVKYTLLGLGILVLVVVAAVATFAVTFDPNRYKGEIERLAKEQTGRTLSIKGDIELAFWPSLGAEVSGVTFSERNSPQEFLSFDSAHASVKLLPLLISASLRGHAPSVPALAVLEVAEKLPHPLIALQSRYL